VTFGTGGVHMAMRDVKVAALVLVCVVAGFCLAGGLLPRAYGASEGMTSGVICVVGDERNGYAPVVVLDVSEQTIVIYEYSYLARHIRLSSARTYRFDKQLPDYETDGVSVEEVRRAVTGQQR